MSTMLIFAYTGNDLSKGEYIQFEDGAADLIEKTRIKLQGTPYDIPCRDLYLAQGKTPITRSQFADIIAATDFANALTA